MGSEDLALNANRLTLVAVDLPANQFGLFLASRTQGFTPNAGASEGNLCLDGTIGRYNAPSQILTSGTAGRIELAVDLALTPQGQGVVPVLAGETWNYQAWCRDFATGGAPTSNFSDALEVQFSDSCPTCTPLPFMVPIPPGTFLMGSNTAAGLPYNGNSYERPVHQVTISYSFWMAQYEVTQSEYQAVMGTNPSQLIGPTRPVEQVMWFGARAYCAALTAQNAANIPAGYEYRLPTEAEWEYACRAGTTTEFYVGDELFCTDARFRFSYHSNSMCPLGGTVPVGSYAPNPFGLYDMHGNVREWCLDSAAPYSGQTVTDPLVTGGVKRIHRGGAWGQHSSSCRSSRRGFSDPTNSLNSYVGFRVVLGPAITP